MPDLSQIGPGATLANRMVDLFTGDRGRPYEAKVMMSNLARLTDLGVRDFQRIRTILDEHVPGSSLLPWFGCTTEIEVCVSATSRACRFGKELAAAGVVDKARLPLHDDCVAVRDFRDAIEHAEERIARKMKKGRAILSGQPNWAQPSAEAAVIGGHRLRWAQLARTLEALHDACLHPLA
ncbi:MAG: hypothetical protein Q8M22_17455 [Actinomycetota bacterium]|nr:hypothetical protein [Actinomycetota bacterium]